MCLRSRRSRAASNPERADITLFSTLARDGTTYQRARGETHHKLAQNIVRKIKFSFFNRFLSSRLDKMGSFASSSAILWQNNLREGCV